MPDNWDRLLINTCLFYKNTGLLEIFKELRDAGAEIEVKTKYIDSHPIEKFFLRRGKIPEEEWKLTRTLKLEPYTDQIKFIFAVTEIGDAIVGTNLAKPLPEGAFLEALEIYYDKIVDGKQCEEFTIDIDGKELTIVPRRTDQNRAEITVEELYTLKLLQDKGIIKDAKEMQEWVNW